MLSGSPEQRQRAVHLYIQVGGGGVKEGSVGFVREKTPGKTRPAAAACTQPLHQSARPPTAPSPVARPAQQWVDEQVARLIDPNASPAQWLEETLPTPDGSPLPPPPPGAQPGGPSDGPRYSPLSALMTTVNRLVNPPEVVGKTQVGVLGCLAARGPGPLGVAAAGAPPPRSPHACCSCPVATPRPSRHLTVTRPSLDRHPARSSSARSSTASPTTRPRRHWHRSAAGSCPRRCRSRSPRSPC
jgi:hypothetical protein